MATATRKVKTTLKQEVALLRSAVIGLIGPDPEGEYRLEFVREILAATAQEPRKRFTTAKAFLAEMQRVDR